MGGKKKKAKQDPDNCDDDLEAIEAEILRGEKPTNAATNSKADSKSGDIASTTEAKTDTKPPAEESSSACVGRTSKKKKKKKGAMDDDELEAALREIESVDTLHTEKKTTIPPSKKDAALPTLKESKSPSTSEAHVHVDGEADNKSGVVTREKKNVELSTPKESNPSTSGTHEGGEATRDPEGATAGDGTEEGSKDKKKKKKAKKGKEEEKKAAKKPGKGLSEAMKKKLQAAREEEERLRQEEILRQESLQREEEEREAKRLEKLRLEQERKERLKQKERERRQKRKLEGKPVTKKEKEAEARRQAQLALLKEQGIEIPDKAESREKKKVLYGNRQRNKKSKNLAAESTAEKEHVESTETTAAEAGSTKSAEAEGASLLPSGTEDDTVENWEDQLEESPGLQEDEPGEQNVKESWEEAALSETETSEEEGISTEEESDEEDSDLSAYGRAKKRIEERRAENDAGKSEDNLRSPVVCVLGHVDTGKTKILDKIRKTHVQDGEAGGITQQIGATFVPQESIREQTKMLKEFSKVEIQLPGLLIIDTPGHESFSNLRTRGSSLCDIAILVVDLMHGLEPQTLESINILLKGKTPFVIALNKVDRLFDWQRNPNSGIKETIKRQKSNTRDQFDERVKLAVRQFAEKELNVALFWEKVDFSEYIPMVPTSAITGDGMGDLIALVVTYSQRLLTKQLMLSKEVEAVIMEVKVISGLGTTVDVILRNGELKEGDTIVLTGIDGPFVTTVRALLLPQPLRELRVKNAYLTPSKVCAAQGVKITAKGDLDKTVAGTPLFVAYQQDEVEVLKEEASLALKSALSAIKLQERGVYVQASTLGSLEALLEFLKQSKIPCCGVNIGPVHKRDVMKASVMLEHDSQWAVILAFDVKVERDAQEMADSLGVKIFSADIIYHLFDSFLKHRQEYRDQKRREFENVAVFPCKLRILPNCVFNTRDPIILGVVVEAGIVKPGTPLTVPSRNFTDIGVVSSLELNHKSVDMARQGAEVCIRVESNTDAPRLYGRHFDHSDLLISKITRESIDAVKSYFREDLNASDWQLIIELKKTFGVI